jgi:16S rRNA processing protein RimM
VRDESGAPTPEHLVVGHVSKPHGTKGEVFVWPLTESPEALFVAGTELLRGDAEGVLDPAAGTLIIERARPFKRGMLVKFEGREDRSAVEPLHGLYVLLPMEALPPLAAGELFYHQLVGVRVETVEGSAVGTVREVYETDPAHLLEVESAEGKRHLIPFLEAVVKSIDVTAGRMVIDPPAGLLEL